MEFPISFPGFENRQLMVRTGSFWSGPKLMIDGGVAPKGPKRGQYLLQKNDGSQVIAQLRNTNFLDPIPQVVMDGQTIVLAEALKWYQWLWGGLPMLLVFAGGLLGGLFGGVATFINGRIFRSNLNGFLKYVITAMVSALAVVGFFVSAVIFNVGIQGVIPSSPKEFRSDTGRFTITTPILLKETVQTVDTQVGKIEIHSFTAEQRNTAYLVVYSDYPQELIDGNDPQQLLDGSRDGAVSNVNSGTLTTERQITLDGNPGRELVITGKTEDGKAVVMYVRIYLVSERLYQVMVLSADKDNLSEEGTKFFDTFKVLDQ